MGGSERSLFLQAQTEISGLLMFSVSSHTVLGCFEGPQLNESERDEMAPSA